MQGINQLHNEIKNLSDQQLVQLMQDPRSTLPKYMVLAEIEGRKPVRQAFDAANVQQPMMTIADESVQEFMGGNPMPADPMANPMPSAPMMGAQGFASGGSTGYQEGGFLKSLGEFTGVIDEEGEIDPVQAALLGLTFVPGIGLALRAGQGAIKTAKGLASLAKSGAPVAKKLAGKAGQALFMKPGPVKAQARRVNTKQPLGQAARDLGFKGNVSTVTTQGRRIDPGKVYTAGVAFPAGVGSLMGMGDAAQKRNAKEQERLEKLYKEQQAKLAELSKKGGLNDLTSGPVKSDRKKMSGLELAQLGGIIAGSVDLSDLGKGIGALATETAKNKRDAALAERKLGIDERRVTAMEEANTLKQNQFLIEQLTAQMQTDYPAFLEYNQNIEKGKTPSKEVQKGYDRYIQSLAQYQSITGIGVASNNNDDAFASQYITQAG